MYDSTGFVTAFWMLVAFWVAVIVGLIFGIPYVYGLYKDYTQKDTKVSSCFISDNNNISFTTSGNCSITCDSKGVIFVNCKGE